MRMKFDYQPICSLCLALAVFSVNIQRGTLAADDKNGRRRHRLMFKMLSSSPNGEYKADGNHAASEQEIDFPTQTDESLERKERTITIQGESNGEPPLIGNNNSPLTLAMLEKFKSTWCKTEPFSQLIKEEGCISRKVLNRFCYGQCNSFYIPKTLRTRTKRKVFKSCGVCKPKRTNTITVTLKCPGKKKGFKHVKVKQIKECQCQER